MMQFSISMNELWKSNFNRQLDKFYINYVVLIQSYQDLSFYNKPYPEF